MKHVPRLKQAIEAFVLGVRSEMGRAGAAGAISVQNLKHRTVEGIEVGSQIVEPSDTDEDELDEQDEDEDDDLQAPDVVAGAAREPGDDVAAGEEDAEEEEEEEEEDDGAAAVAAGQHVAVAGRKRASRSRRSDGDNSTVGDEDAGRALTAEMAQMLQKMNDRDDEASDVVDLGLFDDEAEDDNNEE